MKNNYILIIIVSLIVGAGAFYGGMKYQQSKRSSQFGNNPDFRRSQMQQRNGATMVRGEIISKDNSSITVKLPDESTKIILLSEKTEITKASQGSIDDLKVGEQVAVFGQENPDKSYSATTIQLNPFFKNAPERNENN